MNSIRWVWTLEADAQGPREPVGIPVEVGQSVTIGRDGELRVGVAVPDLSISRIGVTVTAAADSWQLNVTNRNGAVMHPWGQAPLPVTGKVTVSWPLAGVRLRGEKGLEHWVLLESPEAELREDGPTGSSTSTTRLNDRPPALTEPQVEALRCMFADMLCWPPVAHAQPLLLKQVASRLEPPITTEGVQQRLKLARGKAAELGLARQAELADPEYLYVLVRAGYLTPNVLSLSQRMIPTQPSSAHDEEHDAPATAASSAAPAPA